MSKLKSPYFVDQNLNDQIELVGIYKSLPDGSIILSPGDIIEYIPLLIKGSIRIVLQNMDGDEYYLYHIFPGETCAMTLSCCQAFKKSEIKAITEDETELLMIPIKFLDEWTKFPEWKKFVSETLAQRFSELLETIELVAFSKLDEQLWSYLLHRVQASGQRTLHITHQEIAQELHSPREVITRLLHQLQKQGKVELARGEISVNSAL